jgi:2-amino-4-hydroxy-6-hydroxymethyldihydropteridine diphosphokinase
VATPHASNGPGGAAEDPFNATIGLGSNVGDKAQNIARAIELLCTDGAIRLVRRSALYRSPAWGVTDQDWFVNAAIAVATALSPRELLARCQSVETDMGRVRTMRWGPRIIDVDILTYRDSAIREPGLIVPHPLIAERAFVLIPLKDVAPDLRLNGHSLDELIMRLGVEGVVAL